MKDSPETSQISHKTSGFNPKDIPTRTRIVDLKSSWEVNLAILQEENKLVIIRFGNPTNPFCAKMDEFYAQAQQEMSNLAIFYTVDNHKIPDFNAMYELYKEANIMFFFRNQSINVDLDSESGNNKVNWELGDYEELKRIIKNIHTGAKKGDGLVTSPTDYVNKYKY